MLSFLRLVAHKLSKNTNEFAVQNLPDMKYNLTLLA
jgi:hypothetical protein